MKRIVHQVETFKRRGNFIYPRSLRDFLRREPHDIVEGDFTETTIIGIDRVAMKYFYSKGLGGLPNERERITLYGQKTDINNLIDKLKKSLGLIVNLDIKW